MKNKELKGTVSNDKLINDVNLDDTPENLCAFIENHIDKCLSDEFELKESLTITRKK